MFFKLWPSRSLSDLGDTSTVRSPCTIFSAISVCLVIFSIISSKDLTKSPISSFEALTSSTLVSPKASLSAANLMPFIGHVIALASITAITIPTTRTANETISIIFLKESTL